jgi:(2Fe-2S) ferredoxin
MPPFRATTILLRALRPSSSSIPIIPTTPAPTCTCAALPPNLDIDHKTPISNNIATYTSHILVSTAQSDWLSRIEDEKTSPTSQPWGRFVGDLKAAFSRGGKHHDPYRNVLVTTSSFRAAKDRRTALLFPANEEIVLPAPGNGDEAQGEDEALDALLAHAITPPESRDGATPGKKLLEITPLTSPTILICSHHSRDSRCGILGPLLHAEFSRQLPAELQGVRVGMISHIGGHKWAGNVIVYTPPKWRTLAVPGSREDGDDEGLSPLAGKAVWYGRVEPRHVEGIIRETVLGGNVIRDLFRGIVDEKGQAIRL